MSATVEQSPALIVTHFAVEQLRDAFTSSGAAVLGPAALTATWHQALAKEAREQRLSNSWRLTGERASGEIGQDNRRGFLGPLARAFMAASQTADLLHRVTGRDLVPSWSASCYTYYEDPGHFLGEHCDKADACRVALLAYLDARWNVDEGLGPGLMLHVFAGDSSDMPLSLRISSLPNRIVILNGVSHAHLRPAIAPGESLTMLAACFSEADGAVG